MKDNCVKCGAPEPTMHNSQNWQPGDKHCERGPGFLCVPCWRRLNPLLFPEDAAKPTYVSWYRGPYAHSQIEYLRYFPAGNVCQEYYGAGHEYVRELSRATHYATYEEARAVTPVYDGSSGIEARSGVMEVPGAKLSQPSRCGNPQLAVVIVWALFALAIAAGLIAMLLAK